ncbi:hypothetical protein PVAG01_07068 [Phlyctema vagabunda]|uniref:Uncharacterized protein n=1 Tax=Phlyctema vagabunda TaxID=108571 RepID=A0ABR4PBG2_9HELO
MPSKREKQYPNVRARRHAVVEHKKSRKDKDKDKDTDSESVSSTTTSSTDITVARKRECPLRSLYAILVEPDGENEPKKINGCPFRRIQLWHTIPLCLLAIVIPLLVGVTVLASLLGLAGYRIAVGTQEIVVGLMRANEGLRPYAESLLGPGDNIIVEEKQ